jgi:pyruvate,orthophosphate dikinase
MIMQAMVDRHVHDFDAPQAIEPEARVELLGGKGANLAVMATELGLPIPPGFTISTGACRAYLGGAWPDGLDHELRAHMQQLGERLGRRFGDERDPLLVSVRSGAPVSMPGMMDTVLNLGLNEASAAGLAATSGDEAFAADCLRRFRQGYREVIGEVAPDDPWAQLRGAVEAVFRSWNSERARAYRRHEGIGDDIGTAVTVQAMVFGNRGEDSGTGVVFTRNPASGEAGLYGDVMFNAQGEDVVAGTHATLPIEELAHRLPAVAEELQRHAERLERHYADLCDIEFTIERGRLWLLQVRVGKRSPRAALRMAIEMANDDDFPLTRDAAVRRVAHLLTDPPRTLVVAPDQPSAIARGLPASPGVASGTIVTSSDAAEAAAAEGRAVILVRSETSPEDVRGMAVSAGVLTARGGLASHAAVVARGWGIPAVVGAAGVRPGTDTIEIGERSFGAGDEITIDGGTGEIYPGVLEGDWETSQEADILLAWAVELGIEIDAGADEESGGASPGISEEIGSVDGDDVLRALLVKGAVTSAQLSDALLAEAAEVEALVAQLAREGHVEWSNDMLRLTAQGKAKASAAIESDRAALGEAAAGELLEAFSAFDGRVKEVVTAWQIRDDAGDQELNDHADAAYDQRVLDRLAAVHDEASAWITPLAASLRRFAVYRVRLAQALEAARAGDQRFVASPRVDSYHGAWFELHEDLIRLSGRSRSDEAAAGRA